MDVTFNEVAQDKLFCTFTLDDFAEGEPVRLIPGAQISGTVQVEARQDIRCRSAELQLEWHTEGKGDRDGEVIDSKALADGSLRARQSIGDTFAFELPDEPWSYAGHYINIVWTLTVKLDVPLGRDMIMSLPLIVDPGPG